MTSNNLKDVYLLINPNKINNISKRPKFKPIYYYYKDKKKEIINQNNIIKIEISKVKQLKQGCFYKDVYKSEKNKIFDVYYKLKDKYLNCSEVWVEQKKKYKQRAIKIKKYDKIKDSPELKSIKADHGIVEFEI